MNGSPRAFELRRVSFGIPFWETFRAAMNARKSSGFLWKGCKAMQEVVSVKLSDSKREFFVYGSSGELLGIARVGDNDRLEMLVMEAVAESVEGE